MFFAVANRFLHWMVIGLISPVIVLLMLSKGITLPQAGVVMSALSAFVVLFELPSGIVSDKIGRKKVYLVAQTAFLLSFVALAFSGSFGTVLFSFILFGMARAFSSGSIEADFVDSYLGAHGPEKLGGLMTGMGIGETLGLAVGALVGGFLPRAAKALLPGSNEFILNIALQIVLTVTIIAMTLLFHESRHEDKHASVRDFLREAVRLIRGSAALQILLAGAFAWGFAFLAIELYWQPRLKELLADKDNTEIFGFLNSGYFLFAAVGTLAIERLMAIFKIRNVAAIVAIRLVLGAFLIALSFQHTVLVFSVFYLLLMGANGMLTVPESTMFNLAIPADKRSSLLSLSSLVMQLGGICSSLAFSLVVARIGITWIWIIAGLAFSSSAILYFANRKRMEA